MDAPSSAKEPGFTVSLRVIYRILPLARKRQVWLVLLLSLLGGLAELITIGAIVPFLSLLSTGEARLLPFLGWVGSADIVTATAWFITAAIGAGLIRLMLAWQSLSFVQTVGHDLSCEIQRRVLMQPYGYHLAHNSSELVASLELVDQLAYGVIQQLIQALAATIITVFVLAGIALIDARTAIIAAAAFGVIYTLIALVFRGSLRARSKVIAAAYTERVRLTQESVGGIRDVIIDQAQTAHVEAFRRADRRLIRARIETALASTAPRFLVESAGMIVLALLALSLSRSAGGLAAALPVIGALALGAQRLLPLLNQLYQGWSLAAANHALAGNVASLLSLTVPVSGKLADPLTVQQSISFREVCFTYPGRRKPALVDVSVTIPRGARVALIGSTGSGKTTFADLLMGLLEPTAGAIDIDGLTMDLGSCRSWQYSIAHVPQSVFLVDASIARNIALSDPRSPFDHGRAVAAASTAQLDAFLASLPDGFNTIVGERGVRLSGGQRQRIGIARALYKGASVLVLDEATSALDETTEGTLMDTLFEAHPDLTVLIIAHRQSTIERCTIRLHLDHGKLEKLSN